MIRDKLVPLLEQRFGSSTFTTGEPPNPIIIFPAAHPDVGELRVSDDKKEAIVSIGEITHGHFYSFAEDATQDEIEQDVAESVADFIGDLFDGKYLLWRSSGGGAGGWRHVDYPPDTDQLSDFEKHASYYFWSGPTNNSQPA